MAKQKALIFSRVMLCIIYAACGTHENGRQRREGELPFINGTAHPMQGSTGSLCSSDIAGNSRSFSQNAGIAFS